MGIRARTGSIASGGHTLYEVYYDGDWHLLDTMTTMYVFDRATPADDRHGRADQGRQDPGDQRRRRRPRLPGLPAVRDDVTWFANGTKQLERHRRARQHRGRPTR